VNERYLEEAFLMNRQNGFTLIELMIVVVLIGIVAGIAYPSYRNHVVKSNRTAAQGYMMSLSSREEQVMLDQRRYLAAANNAAILATVGLAAVPPEVARFYQVSITVTNTPPAFTITATPIAGTAQSNDGAITLGSDGTKGPAGKWK